MKVAEQSGWIKLHRKLLDNPLVMKDSEYFQVWVYLLLKASHAEYPVYFGGEKINLLPGQLITGRKKIAADTGIDESKVFRILKALKNEQQIEQQVSSRNSLISIVRWSDYQNCEQQNAQQVNSNRTASEQQVNTNKNIKNIKNVKNVKKDKNKDNKDEETLLMVCELLGKHDYSLFGEAHTGELQATILSFIEFRKSIKKPMTEKAVDLLIGKLKKLSSSIPEQIEILNQSIVNGWQGIFPLKDQTAQKGGNNNGFNRNNGRNPEDSKKQEYGVYL